MTGNSAAFGAYRLQGYQEKFLQWAQSLPATWLGRRTALILRKIVLAKKQPVIDAIVDGLKWRLHTQDNVSERKFLFLPQFFDSFERGLLKERLKQGDIFVDIGANAGIYTMTAAAMIGDNGKVVAIEPNPMVLSRLLFNAQINGFEKRIALEPSGISDTEGQFDLTLDDSNLGGSSLVTSRSDRKISVRCYKLLSIAEKYHLRKINALKIDIEGAEDKALIPFFAEAPRGIYPKLIILENSPHHWEKDLPGTLAKTGYRLIRTTKMNQVWEL